MKYDFNLTQKERIDNFDPTVHKDLEQYASYILQDNSLKFNDISLEQLTEEEVTISQNNVPEKKFKIPKIKRSEIIKNNNNLEDWFRLWADIDSVEYMIQFYDTVHNNRSFGTPIRAKLYERLKFSAITLHKNYYDFLSELEDKAALINSDNYYSYCKRLVDLRKQQYTLLPQACFSETFIHEQKNKNKEIDESDCILEIYPFNSINLYKVYELLKTKPAKVFSREYYNEIIKGLQRADSAEKNKIDFRLPENVKKFLLFYKDIFSENIRGVEEEQQKNIFKMACDLYLSEVFENPVLKAIFELRMSGKDNKTIQRTLVDKFNIFYRENYISTIFNKLIAQKVSNAAQEHYEFLEHVLLGRDEFKACPKCGRILPRTSKFFRKRKNNLDGYYNTCKKCGGGQRKK